MLVFMKITKSSIFLKKTVMQRDIQSVIWPSLVPHSERQLPNLMNSCHYFRYTSDVGEAVITNVP